MSTSVELLMYPIADAVQMGFTVKNGLLYGKSDLDLNLVDGIPIKSKMRVVDAVVDPYCGTAGVILKVAGNLYLAMINDDRVKLLTFMTVDGQKAGFNEKFNKHGRLNTLDKLKGNWSRKKFYSLIAPGVKSTHVRHSVEDDWGEPESIGPDAAMAYFSMRMDESSGTKTAEELNKENALQRQLALTGGRK